MTIDKARLTSVYAIALALCSCGLIKPRDEGYFRFHSEEARLVVARCEQGQETGSDCKAAAQAVALLDRAAKGTPAKSAR